MTDHSAVLDRNGIHRLNAPRILTQRIQQRNDLRLERNRHVESRNARIAETAHRRCESIRTYGQSRIDIVKPCGVQGCILYDR